MNPKQELVVGALEALANGDVVEFRRRARDIDPGICEPPDVAGLLYAATWVVDDHTFDPQVWRTSKFASETQRIEYLARLDDAVVGYGRTIVSDEPEPDSVLVGLIHRLLRLHQALDAGFSDARCETWIGEIFISAGLFHEAVIILDNATKRVFPTDMPNFALHLNVLRGHAFVGVGECLLATEATADSDLETAEKVFGHAAQIFSAANIAERAAYSFRECGRARLEAKHLDAATEAVETALSIYESIGGHEVDRAICWQYLGRARYAAGSAESGTECLAAAIRVLLAAGEVGALQDTCVNHAGLQFALGDYGGGVVSLLMSRGYAYLGDLTACPLDNTEMSTTALSRTLVQIVIAREHLEAGRFHSAASLLTQVLAACDESAIPSIVSQCSFETALAYAGLNEWSTAEMYVERAQNTDDPIQRAQARNLHGVILASSGRSDAARAAFDDARALYVELGSPAGIVGCKDNILWCTTGMVGNPTIITSNTQRPTPSAVDDTPSMMDEIASLPGHLGVRLRDILEGRFGDIDAAITALEARVVDTTCQREYGLLALTLLIRSGIQGDTEDLIRCLEALSWARRAYTPQEYSRAGYTTIELTAMLSGVENRLEWPSVQDVFEVIQQRDPSVPLTQRPGFEQQLSQLSRYRYDLTNAAEDLNAMAAHAFQALAALLNITDPVGEEVFLEALVELAEVVEARVMRCESQANLRTCIAVMMVTARHAEGLARARYVDSGRATEVRISALTQACRWLRSLYESTGDARVLDSSVLVGMEAHDCAIQHDLPVAMQLCSEIGMSLRHRYFRSRRHEDIEQAVRFAKAAVDIKGDRPGGREHCLLATTYDGLYTATGDRAHQLLAVENARRAVRSAVEGEDLATFAYTLGGILARRVHELTNRADIAAHLTEAVDALEIANANNAGHHTRFLHLTSLAVALVERHQGNPLSASDLSRAVELVFEAADSVPMASVYREQVLTDLVEVCTAHAQHTEISTAVDRAIGLLERADISSGIGESAGVTTYHLGCLYRARANAARNTNAMGDVATAIELLGRSKALYPPGTRGWAVAAREEALGVWFLYTRTGSADSLITSIRLLREALSGATEADSMRASVTTELRRELAELDETPFRAALGDDERREIERALNVTAEPIVNRQSVMLAQFDLAMRRLNDFTRTGNDDLLDQVVDSLDELAQQTDFRRHSEVLSRLARAQWIRHYRTGDIGDINACINNLRMAYDSGDGILKAALGGDLADAHRTRYEVLRNEPDIEEAIDRGTRALSDFLEASGGPSAQTHNNVGIAYRIRFEDYGLSSDIDAAVAHGETAVAVNRIHGSDLVLYKNNLALAYWRSYRRYRRVTDLERAILVARDGIKLQRDDVHGSVIRAEQLSNLALMLADRAEILDDPFDLDEAVESLTTARPLMETSPARMGKFCTHLGSIRERQYSMSGDLGYLDQAILDYTAGIDACNEVAALAAAARAGLASALLDRASVNNDENDLRDALTQSKLVAHTEGATPNTRVDSAWTWAVIAEGKNDLPQAMEGYRLAVSLMPQAVLHGMVRSDGEYILGAWGDLPRDAAACAIRLGEPSLALELLEQGRGVLWTQLVHARTDLDELRSARPDLAEQLEGTLAAIERAGAGGASQGPAVSLVAEAGKLRTTIDLIRELPRFSFFMGAIPADVLWQTVKGDSHVVVVNTGRSRCDALILDENGVVALPLPDLDRESIDRWVAEYLRAQQILGDWDAGAMVKRLAESRIISVLSWLWDSVALPVLDAIGDDARRICWVPTGALSLLPIHAAGRDFTVGSKQNVPDRVVSTYAPTVRAVYEHARRRSPSSAAGPEGRGRVSGDDILVVAMSETPGHADLPGALLEKEAIARIFGARDPLVNSSATRDAVLERLARVRWSHFSCHGFQSLDEPSESGPALEDGVLSVKQLTTTPGGAGEFIFLSACHSHTTGLGAADEIVTIAAALSYLGWSSVVATMWAVGDAVAAEISTIFYEVVRSGASGDDFALCLHAAIREYRTRHATSPTAWAPFIHVGL